MTELQLYQRGKSHRHIATYLNKTVIAVKAAIARQRKNNKR